jgi:hypothetical protein
MTTKGISPIGRASYVHVFQPQVDKKDPNKKTYSITLLFDKTADLSVMKAAYAAAKSERWPNKAPSSLRSPFRDGDEVDGEGNRKKGDEYKGKIYVTFRAKEDRKPGVVGPDAIRTEQKDGLLYAGCYVKVSFSAYGYEQDGNAGVSFGLNNIQVIRGGERFDGRKEAEEEFTAVEEPSNTPMF